MIEGFTFGSVRRMLDGMVSRVVQDLTSPPIPAGREWAVAIEGFRKVREATGALVADLTQQQVDFRPSPQSWSIAQIIGHLLLSEKMYREQMQRLIDLAREGKATNVELTLQQVNSSVAFIPRDLMPAFEAPLKVFNLFVPRAVREAMFRYPLMPASNPAVSEPAKTAPVDALRADLSASLAATEALYRGPLPSNLKAMTVTHPLMGTNNAINLLALMGAHEERHQTQIRSIQADSQYPWNVVL